MTRKISEIRWPGIALLAIVTAMTLRPGNAPWFFDMSRLMNIALEFNSKPSHPLGISLPFTPAPYGLKGTHGIRYGPVQVWIDQIFLIFTHDPIVMTAVRTAVVGSLIALALLWLTRSLQVTPWLAVVTMLSPWMWYYTRQLWDNSLNVPLAAMVLAAYGYFLVYRRAWSLCLVVVCIALMCLVHLMALPFVIPVAIHLLVFETRWALKFKWPLLVTTLLMLAISSPYLHYFLTFHGVKVPESASRWHGWVFSLFGAQHITAMNVGYFLEESWRRIRPAPLRYAYLLAHPITYIGIIACWAGMILAIPRAWRAMRRHPEAGPIDHLCLIAWATFLFQTVFDGIEHVSEYPHYYNSTWIVYVMFAWLALDNTLRYFETSKLAGRLIVFAYAASLTIIQIVISLEIARNGGTRGDNYSAILSNQMDVAKQVAQFSDASPIDMQVPYWSARPDAPLVLFKLAPHPSGDRPTRRIVVRFRDAFPGDARIVVENFPVSEAGATQP